jgi:hypothetical protein
MTTQSTLHKARKVGARHHESRGNGPSHLVIWAFCLLAGTFLFTLGCVFTLTGLLSRHCGSEYNYYGCELPPIAPKP